LAPDEAGPVENAKLRVRRLRCVTPAQCIAEFPTVVVSIDKRSGYWVERGKALADEQSATPLILIEFK
jgi:hypothetical protein